MASPKSSEQAETKEIILPKGVTMDPETGRHVYNPSVEERKHLTKANFISYSIDNDGFYVTYRGKKRKITETKHYNSLLEALKSIK